MTTRRLSLLALLACACSPAPLPDGKPPTGPITHPPAASSAPAAAVATATPTASAPPSASASASASAAPPEPLFFLPPLPRLHVTTTMAMEGGLVPEKLKTAINRQIHPMARCAPLIRKTDKATASLNLQIAIDTAGAVTPALQSPANAEATKCIIDGARAWTLPRTGAGKAMVLLNIEEDAPPFIDSDACTRDDQCIVGSLMDCCSCGANEDSPRAIHKDSIRKRASMCAAVDCAPCDERERQRVVPNPEREPIPKRAVCRGARCVGIF